MVRAGAEKVLQVSTSKEEEIEAQVVYDAKDYRSVYLQVDHEGEREAGSEIQVTKPF